ncbi:MULTISPECIES: YdeI/OmpD-associated family protein [Cryobacterium]|uniref:Uncharacterized protein n=1 Tax=Cryobacterium breve TaxID=1259258 RepID=A0ABY2J9G0_9MICO|nr:MULTISPECIES: YdeI/OmpD-associated family protein [Cryobacterium]TFC95265.1 hypothetical protein E3T20_06085 [Cryobacterium sp. TmT3-12]TFD00456.1 hypothetical protein E3O65_04580 [Cryobacterium breve]
MGCTSGTATAKCFQALSAESRFATLFRLGSVKRPETRAAKMATHVYVLERGDSLHPETPGNGHPHHLRDRGRGWASIEFRRILCRSPPRSGCRGILD